ncbi:response regulator transcription factor [Geobacter sp. OR-1]|uniref:response regulator transcription factor n=1 Tax=Geobacter sp. OR-1 TaxID=1266765 RepID=UPI0005A75F50|nr:response regulator transcription factor [Geobacter sp. OR-1]
MTARHIGTVPRIKVLIADRQTIVRQGVRSLLEREQDIEVVADTADGEALLDQARQQAPDVIVTEIRLILLSGLDATRRAVAEGLPCRVLVLTDNSDRETIMAAFDSGARGYLLKEADCHCLAEGIRTVNGRGTYLGPRVSDLLVSSGIRPAAPEPLPQLTLREREVLQLLAEGLSSKGIAFQLGISNKTVDTFRRQCLKKLRLKSSADLIRFALRTGLATL